jgi:hypothetical protein
VQNPCYIAIRQRVQKAEESARRRATKYDALVADGLMTEQELAQCLQDARAEGKSVEHLLMAHYKFARRRLGRRLPSSFGVPYEPFNAGRIRLKCCTAPQTRIH